MFSPAQFQPLQLSTQLYAPDNAGFIHALPSQYTYFEGLGTRSTFGMKFEDLVTELNLFIEKTLAESADFLRAISPVLNDLQEGIVLTERAQTPSNADLAQAVINTGHIPIILKGIAPAVGYEKAARSVTQQEVANFFAFPTTARSEANEYMRNQTLMFLVARCRNTLLEMRKRLRETDPMMCHYNKLIIRLDREIILKNQAALPKNYEQFDLATTFFDKITSLLCQMDQNKYGEFIAQALSLLNLNRFTMGDNRCNTYSAQETLSSGLYDLLKRHPMVISIAALQNMDDESPENDDQAAQLTDEQDAFLQDIAPLLAYLNAPTNPFAQNGLHGEIARSAFLTEVLRNYKKHEAKEYMPLKNYTYEYNPPRVRIQFTVEQIDQLLNGKEMQSTGLLQSFFGGNAIQSRQEQLALPTPEQYLRIAYRAPEAVIPGEAPAARF